MWAVIFIGVVLLVAVLVIVNKLATKNARYNEQFAKNKKCGSGNCEVCECSDDKVKNDVSTDNLQD